MGGKIHNKQLLNLKVSEMFSPLSPEFTSVHRSRETLVPRHTTTNWYEAGGGGALLEQRTEVRRRCIGNVAIRPQIHNIVGKRWAGGKQTEEPQNAWVTSTNEQSWAVKDAVERNVEREKISVVYCRSFNKTLNYGKECDNFIKGNKQSTILFC